MTCDEGDVRVAGMLSVDEQPRNQEREEVPAGREALKGVNVSG